MTRTHSRASKGHYWWDSGVPWATNAAFVAVTIVVSCYRALGDAVAIIICAAMLARV
jgi:hypothetical protein